MVVAHIIDSLEAGGAEAVAVNMVNAIAEIKGLKAILIVGRNKIQISEKISPKVTVVHLHKKSSFDLSALYNMYRCFTLHKVQIVHAHSTSFAWPVLLKFFKNIPLVWHDHFGGVILSSGKRPYPYKQFSKYFDAVCCVSKALEESNRRWLKCRKDAIHYLPNFALKTAEKTPVVQPVQGRFLLQLANFREQKDHINLLKAMLMLRNNGCTPKLVLIGNVSDEKYFREITDFIAANDMTQQVQIIVNCSDPGPYLSSAAVGILSSSSEGMPLALLEYGMYGLPVVATNVGEMGEVLHHENAWVVPAKSPQELAFAIQQAWQMPELAEKKATNFQHLVKSRYSMQAVMSELLSIYESLLK